FIVGVLLDAGDGLIAAFGERIILDDDFAGHGRGYLAAAVQPGKGNALVPRHFAVRWLMVPDATRISDDASCLVGGFELAEVDSLVATANDDVLADQALRDGLVVDVHTVWVFEL